MASTAGLVPITRSFLAKYYEKYPYAFAISDLSLLSNSLKEQYQVMDSVKPEAPADGQSVESMEFDPPHKIDENLWRNREQIEEIIFLCSRASWPSSLKTEATSVLIAIGESVARAQEELRSLLVEIDKFQLTNSDRVYNMVLTYMPQDFRCALIKQQRERSEKRRQGEVDALVAAGASIHEKYVLLWKQQMERRKQLAALGSASGVYKTLVKFLVGVPQVLLDFVRQINDHHGPMEEQRERYGPPLYQMTSLATSIHIFLSLWWMAFDNSHSLNAEYLAMFEKAVEAYVAEFKHYLEFMGEVFENSPFLISAEEAGITDESADDFKETTIPAGKTYELLVKAECEGSLVAWDFRLTSGKDIGFSVDFFDDTGNKVPMLPYQRCEAHQSDFFSPSVGSYKLIWDNSYSTFYRKIVRHKVGMIPPVTDFATSPDRSLSEEEEIPE